MIAFLALAATFSPRVSAWASWFCIAPAVVFGIAMALGVCKRFQWGIVRQVIGATFITLLIVAFGYWLTESTMKRAHLRIGRFEVIPPTNGNAPYFNIYVRNDGELDGDSKGFGSYTFVEGPEPTQQVRGAFEDRVFDAMLKSDAYKRTISLQVPTKEEVYMSVVVSTANAETARKLETGDALVMLTGRLMYSDSKGEHHTDYCLYTRKFQRPFIFCQRHNEAP